MDQETPPKLRRRVRLGLWLRNRFFAGVAIAAPIGLTVLVVWWFVTSVDRLVWSLLKQILGPEFASTTIPGVGLIVAALALIALGALAANIAGRAIIQIGERIVARVPLVRTIYNGIKQVFETVLSGRQMTSREICLVQFPREGIWSVGFVTGDARGRAWPRCGRGLRLGLYSTLTKSMDRLADLCCPKRYSSNATRLGRRGEDATVARPFSARCAWPRSINERAD